MTRDLKSHLRRQRSLGTPVVLSRAVVAMQYDYYRLTHLIDDRELRESTGKNTT